MIFYLFLFALPGKPAVPEGPAHTAQKPSWWSRRVASVARLGTRTKKLFTPTPRQPRTQVNRRNWLQNTKTFLDAFTTQTNRFNTFT